MNLLMRAGLSAAVLLLACDLASAPALSAQSDILLRLRSGSPAGERFRVDSSAVVFAGGTLGIGVHEKPGAGYRMHWYPWKASFRAGSATGDNWDHDNLGFYSIAAGHATRARGIYSVAFGHQTVADGQCSVAMGFNSVVHGTSPDFGECGVALGHANEVFKIGGVAIGRFATSGITGTPTGGGGSGAVAIGHQVVAQGDNSLALGNRVSTGARSGAIVIGDRSVTAGDPQIIADANNQFNVRAAGGYRLFSNSVLTAGIRMNAGGSTWSAISDRARKENFADVDGEDVLVRLRTVPVSSWNYIAEGREVRHIGPMAQDWHAAFGLNDDPLTINQGDFDGVNLAAIRALDARTAPLVDEVARLRREGEEKDRRIEALEARLERLEKARDR
jgi:trimeric autotransporter adhesin